MYWRTENCDFGGKLRDRERKRGKGSEGKGREGKVKEGKGREGRGNLIALLE